MSMFSIFLFFNIFVAYSVAHYRFVYRGGVNEMDTYYGFGDCRNVQQKSCQCMLSQMFFMTEKSTKTCYDIKKVQVFSNGCWANVLQVQAGKVTNTSLEKNCTKNIEIGAWDHSGRIPLWNNKWSDKFKKFITITGKELKVDASKFNGIGLLLRISYNCQFKFRGTNIWIPRCTLIEVQGNQTYPLQKSRIFPETTLSPSSSSSPPSPSSSSTPTTTTTTTITTTKLQQTETKPVTNSTEGICNKTKKNIISTTNTLSTLDNTNLSSKTQNENQYSNVTATDTSSVNNNNKNDDDSFLKGRSLIVLICICAGVLLAVFIIFIVYMVNRPRTRSLHIENQNTELKKFIDVKDDEGS